MSDVQKDDCIILNKCIYGFVQAMRQCYKKAVEILKNLGFMGGNVDSCLYVKKSANDIEYIVLYVDDNFMVGNIKAIVCMIAAFKENGLVLKIAEQLQDELSCDIKFSMDEKRA